MGCTDSVDIYDGRKGHGSAISALGVGKASDIDSAALLAISNGIGQA